MKASRMQRPAALHHPAAPQRRASPQCARVRVHGQLRSLWLPVRSPLHTTKEAAMTTIGFRSRKMSITDRIHFKMMSFVHETLYSLFRDPYQALDDAGLKPGQKVLEVGCGPGFFTVPAARTVGEQGSVTALDISPLAVRRVEHKIEQAGVANARTVLADAAQTDLPSQGFDLIFVFGFAHSVGDLEDILIELHRLLKPAGTLSVEGPLQVPNELFRPVKRQGRISQFRKVG
jgi:SAM-dependent methyltransferase